MASFMAKAEALGAQVITPPSLEETQRYVKTRINDVCEEVIDAASEHVTKTFANQIIAMRNNLRQEVDLAPIQEKMSLKNFDVFDEKAAAYHSERVEIGHPYVKVINDICVAHNLPDKFKELMLNSELMVKNHMVHFEYKFCANVPGHLRFGKFMALHEKNAITFLLLCYELDFVMTPPSSLAEPVSLGLLGTFVIGRETPGQRKLTSTEIDEFLNFFRDRMYKELSTHWNSFTVEADGAAASAPVAGVADEPSASATVTSRDSDGRTACTIRDAIQQSDQMRSFPVVADGMVAPAAGVTDGPSKSASVASRDPDGSLNASRLALRDRMSFFPSGAADGLRFSGQGSLLHPLNGIRLPTALTFQPDGLVMHSLGQD